jgi:PilZ domain
MERRLGHRLNHHTGVSLCTTGGRLSQAEIQDLSLSGAFVRTATPGPALSQIELAFPAGSTGKPAAVQAWVIRTASDGIGIEWAEFAPPPVSRLLFAHWAREAAEQARLQAPG